MSDLPTIRASLGDSFAAMETLGVALSSEEWEAQSLCPDWTVRGVVTHVVSIEEMLASWLPDSLDEPPPFARAGVFAQETAGLGVDAFMERVHDVLAHRLQDLDGLAPSDLARPSWTPVGPGTYGRFMEIRIFDLWVHERDITTPLGRPTDDTGARAEIALAEVAGSLGYIVGKKVGLPDGKSIVFHLDGPLVRDLTVVVDGRAAVVSAVAKPDVEVWTDTVTFVQLASGRIDPQVAIDAGTIRWSGDPELGERAARNLRFTM